MGGFKPGDQVLCVDSDPGHPSDVSGLGWSGPLPLANGRLYTIVGLGVWPGDGVTPVVFLAETQNEDSGVDCGFLPRRFRKVSRRDLSAWLETAATDTDHWDKPIKAPAPLHPAPAVDALFRRIMAGGDR